MRILDSSLKRIHQEMSSEDLDCSYRTLAKRCKHGRLGYSSCNHETDKCDECQHWDTCYQKTLQSSLQAISQKLVKVDCDFFKEFQGDEEEEKTMGWQRLSSYTCMLGRRNYIKRKLGEPSWQYEAATTVVVDDLRQQYDGREGHRNSAEVLQFPLAD